MVKYETTVNLEAGTDGVYQKTVVPVPVLKSSRSWIWKTLAVIVVLSLCAAASVFFTLHLMKQDKNKIPVLSGKSISTPSEHRIALQQIAERTKAAIHLHGKHSGSSESIKWVGGVDQSFEQGGLKLEDNKIHIPADGLYFVYSQVSYTVHCKPGKDKDDDNETARNFLSHSIWRYSDAMGEEKPLQHSAHSICHLGENEKTTYSTIYLGAVFKLLEGDKLSTQTTNIEDMDNNYAKTFFGVFAL